MTATPYFLPGWCLGRGPLQSMVDATRGRFLDLPGYHDSPLIEDFDAAIAALAGQLPEASPIVGWSIGAQVALAIAARFPDKVSRLALVAATPSFVQREAWPHAMPPAMLADFAAGIAADAEAMLPRFVGGFNRGDAQAKTVTSELLRLADPRPAAEVLATGLHWLRDVDLRDEISAISVPVLLLHGTADPLMPLATAEWLAARLPAARIAPFTDCAHAPFMSQPEAFLAELTAFLHD